MIEMVEDMPQKIKILVIEGLNVKNMNLRNSLNKHQEFNIVGTTNNENTAMYFMGLFKPEVIIIDLSYNDKKEIDIISRIKEVSSQSKVIVISSGEDKKEILDSVSAGASAFCLPSISIESFSLIIKTVSRGACWFDPVAVPTLYNSFPKIKRVDVYQTLTSPLSARESEVLKLLVNGKSNTEIAEELIVSVHTAKAHVCNILHKMQVTDRVQAAVMAFKLGLV